jgi:hypothetical protein
MWCFLGIGGAFTNAGDSGSLVFDSRGEAIGLFFGDRATGPSEISSVVSLDVVLRDIGDRLGLKNIRLANADRNKE